MFLFHKTFFYVSFWLDHLILIAAQNVLFCKELFSQLAREAVHLQAPIPHMVVGSQITASLFHDIQLIISLCHSAAVEGKRGGGASSGSPPQSRNDHSHVLEHSLHQLLRKAGLEKTRFFKPSPVVFFGGFFRFFSFFFLIYLPRRVSF
jgi:mediator of RNA polymerase II transcription subunit 17